MSISKTDKSCRTIYISNKLLDVLKRLHIRQNKNKLKYGELCIKNIFNERNATEKLNNILGGKSVAK